MSDNEGPVMTDSVAPMNDEITDGDSKTYRFNDRRGPARNSNNRCYTCGQFGHLSYDCRKSGNSVMFRSRNNQRCYNCQREGHISRNCQLPQGAKTCYNCGGEGHISRDCQEPRKERNKNCFKCNEVGHIAAQCPNNRT